MRIVCSKPGNAIAYLAADPEIRTWEGRDRLGGLLHEYQQVARGRTKCARASLDWPLSALAGSPAAADQPNPDQQGGSPSRGLTVANAGDPEWSSEPSVPLSRSLKARGSRV
jgi:hypothetical protein